MSNDEDLVNHLYHLGAVNIHRLPDDKLGEVQADPHEFLERIGCAAARNEGYLFSGQLVGDAPFNGQRVAQEALRGAVAQVRSNPPTTVRALTVITNGPKDHLVLTVEASGEHKSDGSPRWTGINAYALGEPTEYHSRVWRHMTSGEGS